ncbi:MAG: hypothetical protein KF868_17420 [Acidobacteria bacterium]|nr:hypothetical protein [Acidobacteriota bacterium]
MINVKISHTVVGAVIALVALLGIYISDSQGLYGNKAGQESSAISRQSKIKIDPISVSRDIINEASSLPPELTADILLKLVDTKTVDLTKKERLLEDAFWAAKRAKEPFKRVFIGGILDTKEGYLGYAYDNDLDRLSLQCRAIDKLLDLNPTLARELFEQIPTPELDPVFCEEALVFDVQKYYRTLSLVSRKSFDAKAKSREEDLLFLSARLRKLTSPVQLSPALQALSEQSVTAAQMTFLLQLVSEAVGKISLDARSFSYSNQAAGSAIEAVLRRCSNLQVSSMPFLRSLRAYIIQQLSASRCDQKQAAVGDRLPAYAILFNALVTKEKSEVQHITLPEVAYNGQGKSVEYEMYWNSEKASELLKTVQQLRKAGTDQSVLAKESEAWDKTVAKCKELLLKWVPADEASYLKYFHQKNVIFSALREIVAKGEVRDGVVSDHINFLARSDAQAEHPMEWFLYTSRLLTNLDGETSAMLLIQNSQSAPLRLYGKLHLLLMAL